MNDAGWKESDKPRGAAHRSGSAWAVDDGSKRCGQIGLRIDGIESAGLVRLPSSRLWHSAPQKRVLAIEGYGRMVRSTLLLSISMQPSVRSNCGPSEYLAM